MSVPQHKAPTLRHVAHASQVSESTVSKIVNGTKRFSPEVERRVHEAIAELGYTANPHARSVITGKSRAIGVVVADILNPHFALLVKGINSVARARGYTVLLTDSEESAEIESELLRELIPRVDGLIVATRLSQSAIEQFSKLRPLALTSRPSGIEDVPTFGADGRLAGQIIGQYLVQSGHRRVSYLHLRQGSEERLHGLRAAFAGTGVELTVQLSGEPNIEGGVNAAGALLLGAARPDAVVAYNDLMALGLMAEAQKYGFNVPADLSVIGVDDIPYAALTSPPLTTVQLHSRQEGAHAAESLLNRIEGLEVQAYLPLTPQLILRGSSRVRVPEASSPRPPGGGSGEPR